MDYCEAILRRALDEASYFLEPKAVRVIVHDATHRNPA